MNGPGGEGQMLQSGKSPAGAGFAVSVRWSGRGLTLVRKASQRGGEPGHPDGIVSVPIREGHGEFGSYNPPLG